MKKIKTTTSNIVSENILKIKELFPNCVTETKDENENTTLKINFETLKQELSDDVIKNNEKYEFTWPGKNKSILLANQPTENTLRPCKEESVNWDNTQNLYIEGDNLEVLKILRSTYLHKVKLIYIDPPYNTGKDFIYKDNYKKNEKEHLHETNQIDEDENRLVQNKETNGRFHTDWLNMMYPRLKLARDLLTDDGVIFISIDEHEVCNLQKLCDDIFGFENFIENFIWIKNSTKNLSKTTSTNHEYILCYSKNKSSIENKLIFKVRKPGIDEVNQIIEKANSEKWSVFQTEQKLKEFYKSRKDLKGISMYNKVELRKCEDSEQKDYQLYTLSDLSAPNPIGSSNKYEVIHPKTGLPCKAPSRGWAFTRETMNKLIKENLIYFYDDEKKIPRYKRFLDNVENETTKSTFEDFYDGKKQLINLFDGKTLFPNSKSSSLIKRFVKLSKSNDILLDFFSGSSTTAHAVMQLNAEDDGNRKFIMVQLPEPCNEKSEAFREGYKNICEIGKERIRRAGKKIIEETGKKDLDIGFRVFKLDSSNMKKTHYLPEEYNLSLLENNKLYENIKKDRTPEDLLIQSMLEFNILLSSPIKEELLENKRFFNVNNDELICYFEDNLTDDLVEKILYNHKDLKYFVTRDSSVDDNTLTNVEPLIKIYNPNLKWKVI